jgi:hypothetical protein
MRLLIDADPMIYACAFAAEEHTYHVVIDDGSGRPRSLFFGTGKEKQDWVKENKAAESPALIIDQFQQQDIKPLSYARTNLNSQLHSIRKEVAKHWGQDEASLDVHLILSGNENFREEYSTIRGYKANREGVRKPEHHGALREYMTHNLDARIVDGREADDEISILACEAAEDGIPHVVATIDKDLDQIPGLKYDYLKKVFYEVHPEEARVLFWAQVLSGDATDNIPGVPGIGKKIAERLVQEWMLESKSDEEIWQAVVEVFENGRRHAKCEYSHMKPEDAALETARLIHLQQYPGQLWTPPGQDDERLALGGLDD